MKMKRSVAIMRYSPATMRKSPLKMRRRPLTMRWSPVTMRKRLSSLKMNVQLAWMTEMTSTTMTNEFF